MQTTTLLSTLFALLPLINSSPIPLQPRDTAELYILSNCYNSVTLTSYASAFWYYPDFLPDYPEPQATGIISATSAVDFPGLTISIITPFTLKTVIPSNATAELYAYEDVVASASISSFAGPAAAIMGTGEAFYYPDADTTCYYNFGVRDNQTEDDV